VLLQSWMCGYLGSSPCHCWSYAVYHWMTVFHGKQKLTASSLLAIYFQSNILVEEEGFLGTSLTLLLRVNPFQRISLILLSFLAILERAGMELTQTFLSLLGQIKRPDNINTEYSIKCKRIRHNTNQTHSCELCQNPLTQVVASCTNPPAAWIGTSDL